MERASFQNWMNRFFDEMVYDHKNSSKEVLLIVFTPPQICFFEDVDFYRCWQKWDLISFLTVTNCLLWFICREQYHLQSNCTSLTKIIDKVWTLKKKLTNQVCTQDALMMSQFKLIASVMTSQIIFFEPGQFSSWVK